MNDEKAGERVAGWLGVTAVCCIFLLVQAVPFLKEDYEKEAEAVFNA